MSSKTPAAKIEATKMLPPKEMMVTRRKNAESQRQLRKKDRSMTKITQLLMRSPPKQPKPSKPKTPPSNTFKIPAPKVKTSVSPKKAKKSLLKNVQKQTEETLTEYYPNKKKRVLCMKKIMLKPKHQLKVVDGLNKRKRTTPQSSKPDPLFPPFIQPEEPTPLHPNSELVRTQKEPYLSELNWTQNNPTLSEQNGIHEDLTLSELISREELGDEDLMEILTCPSPVWWEDPPSREYDEDPIWPNPLTNIEPTNQPSLRKNDHSARIQSNDTLYSELITKAETKENKLSSKTDGEFAKKRFGLENILCNIKFSKLIDGPANGGKLCQTDDNVKNKSASETSSAEDIFSEVKDDILTDLENLDIPIGTPTKSALSSPECITVEDPVIKEVTSVIDIESEKDQKTELEGKFEMTMKEGSELVFMSKIKRKKYNVIKANESMSPKTLIWTSNTGDKKIINLINDPNESPVESKVEEETGNIDVPKQMPPLQKFSKVADNIKIESPTDSKSEQTYLDNNDSSSNLSCEFEANNEFGDQNIETEKVANPDEKLVNQVKDAPNKIDKTDEVTQVFLNERRVGVKRKLDAINDDTKYIIDNKQDCIVVYKIIDNEGADVKLTDEKTSVEDATAINVTNTETKEAANQNGSINDFFKKCKSVNRKVTTRKVTKNNKDGVKTQEMEMKEIASDGNAKKPIAVSEVMNYCLRCSSIFETSNCIYCCKKNRSDENHNFSVRLKKVKKLDA